MNWRFWGRRKDNDRESDHVEKSSHEKRVADAVALVKESESLLVETQKRVPGLAAHLSEMRRLRERNGFAADVLDAFKGI